MFRLRRNSDGLENQIMLFQLFDMQNLNSARLLCFNNHPEEGTAASTENCCTSPHHCHAKLPPRSNHSSSPSSSTYAHKHPYRKSASSSQNNSQSQNLPDRHYSDFVSRPRVDWIPNNICHRESIAMTGNSATLSCNPGTKSEPATRSNSVDCDKDFPNFLAAPNNRTGETDTKARTSDLTVPNGKFILQTKNKVILAGKMSEFFLKLDLNLSIFWPRFQINGGVIRINFKKIIIIQKKCWIFSKLLWITVNFQSIGLQTSKI